MTQIYRCYRIRPAPTTCLPEQSVCSFRKGPAIPAFFYENDEFESEMKMYTGYCLIIVRQTPSKAIHKVSV